MILDLFAGPGGVDEGMRTIGITDVIGLEWEPNACRTRAAAGHRTVRTDIALYPPQPFVGKVRGLWASPPCTAFSSAGKQLGKLDLPQIHATIARCRDGWRDEYMPTQWADKRAALILEPLRWAWALKPRWIACEQVPPALEVWEHMAAILRGWGYDATALVLNSADYGRVMPCPLHASSAISLSDLETALAFARPPVMTVLAGEPIGDALIVADHLVKVIGPAFAGLATCDERVRHLVALGAGRVPSAPGGRVADVWTSVATSVFEEEGHISGNIGLWLSGVWDDLWSQGRLSTTSTETPPITVLRILKSIRATAITCTNTGVAAREAGCGLCVDYATPQTRKRAFLLAHRDGVKVPAPTHAKHPKADLFGETLKPWISMAAALGWNGRLRDSFGTPKEDGNRAESRYKGTDIPSPAVCSKSGSWVLQGNQKPPGQDGYHQVPVASPAQSLTSNVGAYKFLRADSQKNAAIRSVDEPAPTFRGGNHLDLPRFLRSGAQSNATVPAGSSPDRTVAFGHDSNRVEWTDPAGDSVPITVEEASILQGFRSDYPWQGTKTAIFQQIGNCVPGPLAAAIVGALDGR